MTKPFTLKIGMDVNSGEKLSIEDGTPDCGCQCVRVPVVLKNDTTGKIYRHSVKFGFIRDLIDLGFLEKEEHDYYEIPE